MPHFTPLVHYFLIITIVAVFVEHNLFPNKATKQKTKQLNISRQLVARAKKDKFNFLNFEKEILAEYTIKTFFTN